MAQTHPALLIRSRMTVGLAKYRVTHPGADVVLFEPRRDDADTFFTNIFSLSSRRRLCEHAYLATRADLLARQAELDAVLRRHGLSINTAVLRHPARRLVRELRTDAHARLTRTGATLDRLGRTLDDLGSRDRDRERAQGRRRRLSRPPVPESRRAASRRARPVTGKIAPSGCAAGAADHGPRAALRPIIRRRMHAAKAAAAHP